MAVLNLIELWRIAIMVFALTYIFSDLASFRQKTLYEYYKGLTFKDLLFVSAVTGPAVVLHELAHKFVALLFGLAAELHVSIIGLLIGIVLKMVGSPLIIFVPGFVSIGGTASGFAYWLTAFAGPLSNLTLFLTAYIILKKVKIKKETRIILVLTKNINLWLFIFNMLPIPPFDGFKVFSGIVSALNF